MALEIATALLPVFFVMALGYGAGKTRLIDNRDVSSLNTLVMTIALPISLFAILAASKRSDVIEHWSMAVILLVVMGVVYAGTYVIERRAYHLSPGDSAIQALTVSFPNAAAVGLPLADSVLGRTGGLAVAAVLAVGSITLSPVTIVILEREKTRQAAPSGASGPAPAMPSGMLARAIGTSLRKPIVIAPVLGLVWTLLGIPLPALIESTLNEIGSVTAGLALFLTGLVLSAQRFPIGANAIVSTVLTAIMRPVLAFLAIRLIALPAPMAQETLLLLAVPAGFFGILLGLRYDAKPPVAGTTLLLSSVLSAVTLTILITFLPHL